ncbi:hypothetical protein LUZ61_010581 [Rhynchospora tenuis]|uniref:HMA domain-containing protein n=1 Tax=Rhynchospora tenuis TaxID=198213 RepID=A0AAD5ZZC6_9POAL|nr:hypothetical protein LUZ61_010581 [Rhynchospora tenuis]
MFRFWEQKGSISDAMSIVELNVHMDCDGCQKRIRKAITKLDGVNDVEIDMDKQKVTVTGYVDQKKVLRAVRRTGRKAEYWPFPYDSEFYLFAIQYLDDNTYTSTHNYYQHGNNPTMHGYYADPAYSVIVDDEAAWIFNEDNVHACAIM